MLNPHHIKPTLLAASAAILACSAILAACANTTPTAPTAPGIVANEAPVTRGHRLYTTDCAACHRARDPRTYTKQRWDEVLPRMEDKSKLNPEDRRALEAYITANLSTPASN